MRRNSVLSLMLVFVFVQGITTEVYSTSWVGPVGLDPILRKLIGNLQSLDPQDRAGVNKAREIGIKNRLRDGFPGDCVGATNRLLQDFIHSDYNAEIRPKQYWKRRTR